MKKTIPFLLLASITTPVTAQISDYELRRLPASVANEFQNANGDTRLFIPTSINDQGHLSGMRLTLKQGADPNIENDFIEASYIYDLNNRQFIAQSIPGTSIVHIGTGHYISKRFHPNGNRWQTYRCNYSATINNEIVPPNNPACTLIDNDYLGNAAVTSSPATWRNLYKVSLMILKNAAQRVTTKDGDTLVADFTDDPQNAIKVNVYLKNGPTVTSDSIISSLKANGFPDMDSNTLESSYGSLNNLTSSSPSLFLSIPSGQQFRPTKIDLTTMQVTESLSQIDQSDPITNPIGISQSGSVYYAGGHCNSSDLCDNRFSLNTSSIEQFTTNNNLNIGAANQEIFLDENEKASFFKYCYIKDKINGDTTPCESDIYFFTQTESDFIVDDIPDVISQKFPEDVIQGIPYSAFSGNSTTENREITSFFTEGSPNGKYLTVVVPTTAKNQQAYVFIRN